jgi:hypothetical protein
MSTSPRESEAPLAGARPSRFRSLSSALAALVATCAALSLAVAATGLVATGQILVAGPGGPLLP